MTPPHLLISIRTSGGTHSLREKVSRFTHITPGLHAAIVFVSKMPTRIENSRDHFAFRHTPEITTLMDLHRRRKRFKCGRNIVDSQRSTYLSIALSQQVVII